MKYAYAEVIQITTNATAAYRPSHGATSLARAGRNRSSANLTASTANAVDPKNAWIAARGNGEVASPDKML